ncbi:undecaprenyl-diphosphate phosphatase [Fulvivirgaceae bacterium PWU4]|uniref:Undecaprenyl-diphosphatase n=1 Tax=Chryseosolibacter histidini TaxID=2782349 RepID=A0AAP2DG30_9BACT|nr:undecaprenyl-diphosphate phosphatase [Chryseosolibacter histidini]MBT1695761.1 undecaprenyl-diphosphate phosphatase [Chryseosolibacter histidini]
MSIFESIVLAIIEGITEFLPISSTGHMIIGSSVMGIADDPFTKMFTVSIQFGAILSVVVLYWKRFFQSLDFYYKILVAFIPAAIAGLLFKDKIDALLERVDVVGFTLLLGGIFFLVMDKIFKPEQQTEEKVTYPKALKIGCFQVISMIPGVSRSAATIIGGLSQKLTRKAAAEFSFFLAVPTMFAATALTIFKFYWDGGSFGKEELTALALGNVVAFVVAMLAIKSFITFLTRHGFAIFGYYRIIVGIIILVLYYLGVDLSIV